MDTLGGPDSMWIYASSGSAKVFSFGSGEYRDKSNYIIGNAGTADESPGWSNSAANLAFINSLKGGCPLTLNLMSFELMPDDNNSVKLFWESIKDVDQYDWYVERSGADSQFVELGKGILQRSKPNSFLFEFLDQNPLKGINYYRLERHSSVTLGMKSKTIFIDLIPEDNLWANIISNLINNQVNIQINLLNAALIKIEISDLLGNRIFSNVLQLNEGRHDYHISFKNLRTGINSIIYRIIIRTPPSPG